MPFSIEQLVNLNTSVHHHSLLLLCPRFSARGGLSLNALKQIAKAYCGISLTIEKKEDDEEELMPHPDVFVATRERETLRLEDVEQIRSLAQYPASLARRRLFFIDRAERLNLNSANSLLKILEEPPTPALFLLTARREADVLETISSRCYKIAVDIPSPEDVTFALDPEDREFLSKHLNKGQGFERGALSKTLWEHQTHPLPCETLATITEGCERIAKKYPFAELHGAVSQILAKSWGEQPEHSAAHRLLKAEIMDWTTAEPFHPSSALWLCRLLALASRQ